MERWGSRAERGRCRLAIALWLPEAAAWGDVDGALEMVAWGVRAL
ncbi:hypothetical protein [Pseudactinotalea suaedae]|nr:hypothetical protein [Pseudactinotalea suaedae]